MSKKYSEDIQRLLKTVVDDCVKEDREIRERQVRVWKRLKLLWEGFTQVWYSEVAHDWRIYDPLSDSENDQSAYDKSVNVFRAYLESIIAALSIVVPPIKCYPDDADNPLDLSTARAGDQISQLVDRHNNVTLLWLHSLFIFCTEGMVACYGYPKSDKEYGTYDIKKHEDVTENHESTQCPNCGYTMNDRTMAPAEPFNQGPVPSPIQSNPIQSNPIEGQNPEIQNELNQDEFMPDYCESCGNMVTPQKSQNQLIVTRLVGITKEPKSRIMMESYGGLNIKIPSYARRQSDCSYLSFEKEIDYSFALESYPDLEKTGISPGTTDEYYDQWARLSPQYHGEYPINVVTERKTWIRPAKFNILKDKDDINLLKSKFPDGACVTQINGNYAEAYPSSLDDSWTILYNPLSDYIHFNPLGLLLSSIQEITGDIVSLTLQTIEHGIGSTFADPAVLNFEQYRQTEVLPGSVFPAKPGSGKSLNESFHELRTATLSAEVLPFHQAIQSMGQLVSGALPSLFGGQLEGSDTASEYSMSRAQSMQRLQTTWMMFTSWWKEIHGKIIPMYIKEVKKYDEDEKDVQLDPNGNFINVFIRKAELEGKIGKIELEANKNIPLTWNQQKDVVMSLFQNANPEVMKIISAPENLPLIHSALGLVDFFVPGEADREKQYDEIKLLVNSSPITQPPQLDPMTGMMGQPQEVPSIEVEQEVDDHEVHFNICRKWLVSEAGRQAKTDTPDGYKNVLLHARMHLQIIQQSMQQAPAPPNESTGKENPSKPKQNTKTPVTGESNVSTVQ